MNQLAQITNPAIKPDIGGLLPQQHISANDYVFVIAQYVGIFLRIAFIVGTILFFVMLIIGAVEYITAGGEKEKAGNAAKRITNAIIGLVILFSLFAILALLKLIFGIDILLLNIPVIV